MLTHAAFFRGTNFFLPAADYHSAQQFLHQHLPPDAGMFNEFHALLVEAAKRYCHRNVAHCEECPLGKFLGRNSKLESRNSKIEIRDLARNLCFDSGVSVLVRG
jgi:hypothetical protein